MPARCPSTRGRCRCAAQRPLPSMMTATCAGSRLEVDLPREALLGGPGRHDGEDVFEGHAGTKRDHTKGGSLTVSNPRSQAPNPDHSQLQIPDELPCDLRLGLCIGIELGSGALYLKLTRPAQYPTCIRNSPCGGAVRPASERSRDSRTAEQAPRVPAAGADFDQRPDDVPDHVAEEAVAGHSNDERQVESRAVFDIEREDRAHRCLPRTSRRPGSRRSRGGRPAAPAAVRIASRSSGCGTCQT